MKKTFIIVLLACLIFRLSYSQTKPVEIFTSQRLWRSIPTKKGGFKFTATVNVKHEFRFAFYKDRITLDSTKLIVFRIEKINDPRTSEGGYTVVDPSGNKFIIVLHSVMVDKKWHYDIDFFKATKDGTPITLTMFECKKVSA